MSNYNPNTPAALGMQWRPTVQTDETFSGTSRGIAMRVMVGATTIDTVYPFFKSVEGTSGWAGEMLSSIERPVAPQTSLADGSNAVGEHHFIGIDTGSIPTNWVGWERQDNNTTAANLRAAVDEYPANTTDYVRNISALTPSTKLIFAGRGNDTALTGKRITAVEIVVAHRTIASSSTTRQGPRVQGYLNLGGTAYYQNRGHRSEADGKWRQPAIGYWTQNPSTNKPWTQAEVNLLVSTTATDEWGLQVDGATVAAEGYNVSMLVMVVFTTGTTGSGAVGDVRKGFLYQPESPSPGWNTFALGSTSAESAATYYWFHQYPLAGGSFTVPILKDPRADFAPTTAATQTGQHRQVYITHLGPGGVIQSYEALPGAMIPVLFSAAGTFNNESQAYAELANLDEDSSSTANLAQQVTTTGTPPTYKSLRLPVGWASATPPTAPLNIQIQHGANANIGGGTLLASIFVQPSETTQQVLDRSITLAGGITPPASTKLFVLIDSAAATGAGWKIARADTRSDATVGPTVANIEGQSQGGQTDSQSNGTTDFDRYDIPVVLLGDPGEVGGTPAPAVPVLTATVEAGV